jgi:hypothetical protein
MRMLDKPGKGEHRSVEGEKHIHELLRPADLPVIAGPLLVEASLFRQLREEQRRHENGKHHDDAMDWGTRPRGRRAPALGRFLCRAAASSRDVRLLFAGHDGPQGGGPSSDTARRTGFTSTTATISWYTTHITQ